MQLRQLTRRTFLASGVTASHLTAVGSEPHAQPQEKPRRIRVRAEEIGTVVLVSYNEFARRKQDVRSSSARFACEQRWPSTQTSTSGKQPNTR
jgi:hypothetical protein